MMKMFLATHKNFSLNVCAIIFLFLSQVGNAQGVGVGTTKPLSTFEVNGSTGQTVTTVTGNLTLDASHSIVICDKGATTITLPDATQVKGRVYIIKRSTNNTEMVTIKPYPSQTIDGEMHFMLMTAKESATVVSDGDNWRTLVSSVTVPMMDQIPMGEIGFFSVSGFAVDAPIPTVDGTELKSMYPCKPKTSLSSASHGFSNGGADNGVLKYIGTTRKSFHIACTISIAPVGSNGIFIFELTKNAVDLLLNSRLIQKFSSSNDIQSTALHAYVTLDPGDFLELCVGQNAGTNSNMSVKTLNLFAMGM